MRLSIAIFLTLLAVFTVGESFKFPLTSRHPIAVTKYVHKQIKMAVHHVRRERRQSFNPACIQDAMQVSRDPFASCEQMLETIDNGDGENNVNLFCRHNCSRVILDLFLKIKNDCGDAGGNEIDPNELLVLNFSCSHDPKGRVCLYDWYNGENIFPDSDKQAYQNCVDTYQDGTCPSDCTTALTDINRNFGCCYPVFYNTNPAHQTFNGTGLIPLTAYKSCRITQPGYCTS